MEKLQAALQKARERRGTDQAGAPGPFVGRRGVGSSDVASAWDALREIQLDTKKLLPRRLVALAGGSEATPFDVLRTKVLQLMDAGGWKRVMITSPSPGSGKTTTSANLAISIARQRDLRVMLLDLDMRRPALAKLLDYRGEEGVDAVLSGHMDYRDQARRLGPNLALSMNFVPSRDPSDLFLRQSTSDVIDVIEQTYRPDIMLFDMPPLMVNDDTTAFVRNVDCVLIIAEAGVSTLEQIDQCEKELAERTNVLGVVLNKCRFQSDNQYYYYNYGY